MGEEVLVTEVRTGRGVARVKGVSIVKSRFNMAGYNANYSARVVVSHHTTDSYHLPPVEQRAVLPSAGGRG